VTFGEVFLWCADPEITQELMTTKNTLIDKDPRVEALLAPIIGYAVLFGKATD